MAHKELDKNWKILPFTKDFQLPLTFTTDDRNILGQLNSVYILNTLNVQNSNGGQPTVDSSLIWSMCFDCIKDNQVFTFSSYKDILVILLKRSVWESLIPIVSIIKIITLVTQGLEILASA